MKEDKKSTYDQLVKSAEKATSARKAARKALEELAKKAGVNPKQVKKGFDHKEHGKELKALNKKWVEMREEENAALEAAKKMKPASEKKATKYDYPADVVTDADKKRYRASMRAKAAKDAKGEDEAPAKASKKDSKEKPEKEEKKSKKDKKDKKVKDED